jgi:hypothetical protein
MSNVDEFRHYAEEALHWADDSATDDDRAILLYLARIWMLAASSRSEDVGHERPGSSIPNRKQPLPDQPPSKAWQ